MFHLDLQYQCQITIFLFHLPLVLCRRKLQKNQRIFKCNIKGEIADRKCRNFHFERSPRQGRLTFCLQNFKFQISLHRTVNGVKLNPIEAKKILTLTFILSLCQGHRSNKDEFLYQRCGSMQFFCW